MFRKLFLLMLISTSILFSQQTYFSMGYKLLLAGSLPGLDIVSDNKSLIEKEFESQSSFEWGLLFQPTYNVLFVKGDNFYNYTLLSFAFDFGYYNDSFKFINYNNKRTETHLFDSINLGLYVQTTFSSFFIGAGGGVKLALSGNLNYDYIIEVLNYDRLKSRFDDLYIPYIKFLVGFKHIYGFSSSSISFYFNYDFPNIKLKASYPDIVKFKSIDLGVELSYYINFIPILYKEEYSDKKRI